MSYSSGIQQTYFFGAFAGVSSAGQSAEKISGPPGLTGRVVAMNAIANVGVTAAPSSFTLRDNLTTTNIYASLAVPITAIEVGISSDMVIDDTGDTATHVSRIAAGTALELNGDGASTAGDLDVWVTIEWS
tara:strand:+ start:189 stop:581 length:393 start_codon:yes stop_codon:yes gene_type:complete